MCDQSVCDTWSSHSHAEIMASSSQHTKASSGGSERQVYGTLGSSEDGSRAPFSIKGGGRAAAEGDHCPSVRNRTDAESSRCFVSPRPPARHEFLFGVQPHQTPMGAQMRRHTAHDAQVDSIWQDVPSLDACGWWLNPVLPQAHSSSRCMSIGDFPRISSLSPMQHSSAVAREVVHLVCSIVRYN